MPKDIIIQDDPPPSPAPVTPPDLPFNKLQPRMEPLPPANSLYYRRDNPFACPHKTGDIVKIYDSEKRQHRGPIVNMIYAEGYWHYAVRLEKGDSLSGFVIWSRHVF